jgi:hypothetical protein
MPPAAHDSDAAQARLVLGLSGAASEAELQAAYWALRAHIEARAVESDRQSLNQPSDAKSATTSTDGAETAGESQGSFGAVTRTQGEQPQTFWERIYTFIKRNLENAYTFILFVASEFLWRPVLVQLTVLFLLLFGIYHLAKRFGGRPS